MLFYQNTIKEKESLTAYIHHFRRETKRCNFTNNTATISILVKVLTNVICQQASFFRSKGKSFHLWYYYPKIFFII